MMTLALGNPSILSSYPSIILRSEHFIRLFLAAGTLILSCPFWSIIFLFYYHFCIIFFLFVVRLEELRPLVC